MGKEKEKERWIVGSKVACLSLYVSSSLLLLLFELRHVIINKQTQPCNTSALAHLL